MATNKVVIDQVQIFIYDVSGKLILTDEMVIGKKSIQLDLINYISGIYFYQVIGTNGISASGRVVKY